MLEERRDGDMMFSLVRLFAELGKKKSILLKTQLGHFRKTHGEGGRRVANRVTEGEASGVQGAG